MNTLLNSMSEPTKAYTTSDAISEVKSKVTTLSRIWGVSVKTTSVHFQGILGKVLPKSKLGIVISASLGALITISGAIVLVPVVYTLAAPFAAIGVAKLLLGVLGSALFKGVKWLIGSRGTTKVAVVSQDNFNETVVSKEELVAALTNMDRHFEHIIDIQADVLRDTIVRLRKELDTKNASNNTPEIVCSELVEPGIGELLEFSTTSRVGGSHAF